MERLKNKRALVTGAGGDIGRGIILRMAEEGARLILCDINQKMVDQAVNTVKEKFPECEVLPVICNVVDEEQVKNMIETANEVFGGVDILVNNAGINRAAPMIQDSTFAEWKDTLDINLTGMFLCCKYVADQMMERRYGKIVSLASLSSYTYRPGQTIQYAASKCGVMGITMTLAGQLGPYGINVNAVAPGVIETKTLTDQPPEFVEKIRKTVILNRNGLRNGTPEDVANAIVFLASDEASYITGETLKIAGGALIC